MKKMEIFCKSPSSTAICSSLDHRSMVRHQYHSAPSTPKIMTPIFAPCSSSHDPTPSFHPADVKLRRRSTSVALTDLYKKPSVPDTPKQSTPSELLRRRSSADVADLLRLRRRQHHSRSESTARLLNHDAPAPPPPFSDWVSESARDQQNRSKMKVKSSVYDYAPVREIERRNSSASDPTQEPRRTDNLVGWVRSEANPKHDAVSEITPVQTESNNTQLVKSQDCPLVLKSSSAAGTPDVQVVELRVSIHCKGCEGKVRKHISKMEGVTSFSIDVTTKKVTVKGNVTPMAVLSSISKVKSATLWSTSALPPRPPAPANAPRWST